MKGILLLLLSATSLGVTGQQQTFDLLTYTPPGKGWKKTEDRNRIVYSVVDNKTRKWCQIAIFKSTTSQGNIESDINKEWQDLVVSQLTVQEGPIKEDVQKAEGWEIQAASGKFLFNNEQCAVILTSFSGYNVCLSLMLQTNAARYLEDFEKLVETISLSKPNSVKNDHATTNTQTKNNKPVGDGYAFTTTNFDDGWTSTVQEDWIEVTKGNIKVLLHYPKEGTVFPADPEPLTNAAWNILVAPRYSNLKNYRTAYITTYNRPYLGMGYATENSTGKEVFVLLFRQGGGWIEFITPDKNTFIQQYKFDPETVKWDTDSDLMNPLANMNGYNRFAVAASDFKGKWTSDFTGIQQLYNVYTGQYAGMNVNQSNEEFIFNTGNTYNWKLLVVNGIVGNAKYTEVKSAGQFNVPNNWQIYFSKIETGPRTFHAFWSCIKGGRILNLLDADAAGSGIYTQFGLAK